MRIEMRTVAREVHAHLEMRMVLQMFTLTKKGKKSEGRSCVVEIRMELGVFTLTKKGKCKIRCETEQNGSERTHNTPYGPS